MFDGWGAVCNPAHTTTTIDDRLIAEAIDEVNAFVMSLCGITPQELKNGRRRKKKSSQRHRRGAKRSSSGCKEN